MRAVDRLLAPLVADESRTNVLWGTFFAALFVRLWLVREHPVGDFIVSDMWVYDMRAGHLVDRDATPWDTFTPVGYPAFLALVYRAAGKAYEAIGTMNALMGAATAVLANLVARRVTGSAKVAVISGALTGLYPPLVFYCGLLLTEAPSAFLLTLAVWLVLRAGDEATWGRVALAGAVFAVGVAVRPNFLLGLPAIVWFAWLRCDRDRRKVGAFVARFACGLAPLLLVVCVHNTHILGKTTGIATNGGLNFFLAHSRVSAATYLEGTFTHRIMPIPNMVRYPMAPAFASPVPFYDDGFFYRKGLAEIAARPSALLGALDNVREGVGLGKQGFWPGWTEWNVPLTWIARAFALLAIVPALVLGAAQAATRRLRAVDDAGRALVWGLLVSTIATMYLFLGDPRVRVPFDPLFTILALEAWRRLAAHVLRARSVTRTLRERHGRRAGR